MTNPNKKSFLARLMRERDKFELLLNRVGYIRRMTLKGIIGKHSIKDNLAHIWAYEQFIADRMHEIAHNQPYTPCKSEIALDSFLDEFGYPDFGSPLLDNSSPNAWIIERYANVSLDEIVAQEIEAFVSIVSAIEAMSEEIIHEHNLYNRVARHTYDLYHRHTRDIMHWLETNGIQLK